MKQRLVLRWPTRPNEIEAMIEWQNGKASVLERADDLEPSLARLLTFGLDEWVGERNEARPRHTDPRDPEFLRRLGDYFHRQGGFIFTFVEATDDLTTVLPNSGV